jgi:hypothetical protein
MTLDESINNSGTFTRICYWKNTPCYVCFKKGFE